ncbi:MAG: efflux RND transporter periplasmic adaptor subunit [Oscillospiraceae bacterium]
MNKTIKRVVAGVISLAVIGAGGYAVYRNIPNSSDEKNNIAKTNDYTVVKGDITVGISESGTVTLNREYVTFAADAEVAEILYKVGMTVGEGDSIARFDTDDITNVCADYEKQIAAAQLAYLQAQVDAKSKLESAKQTYEESISSASLADSDYSLTITQLTSDITSAKNKLESDKKQLSEYTELSLSYPDDYAVLCAFEEKLEEYEAVYKSYENTYSEYESEYRSLSKEYTEYEKTYKSYEKELTSLNDEHNEYLDSISDKQEKMNAAKAEVDEAKQAAEAAKEACDNESDSSNIQLNKLTEYIESYQELQEKYNNLAAAYEKEYRALELDIKLKTELYESKVKKQEQKMSELSNTMDEYKTKTLDLYSEKMSDYQTDVMQPYSDMLSDYREEYNEFKTEFQDKYGNQNAEDIDEQIASLTDSIENDSYSIDKANHNYDQSSLSAKQQLSSTQSKAELAKEVYDITVAQINAELENTKEAYDKLVDEYNTFLEEIDAGGYVFAPCSGIISAVSVSDGDSYMANQPLVTIMDSGSVYISLAVSENDISSLSVGQKCEITLSAFENKSFSGEIDTISAEPARSSGSVSYTVTVKMESDGNANIHEGMTADVTFLEKQVKDVLYINVRAVSYHDGSNWVKVYDENGNMVEKAVKTGFSDGRYVEIIDGLAAGDVVAAESAVTMK